MLRISAALVMVNSPFLCSLTMSSKLSGSSIGGRPNFVPFSLAAAMPSACRRFLSLFLSASTSRLHSSAKIKELENEVAHERPDIFLSRPRIKERYIEYGDIGLLLFRENLPFLRHLLVVTGQICEAGKIKHVAGLQLLQEFLNFLVLRLPVNENVLLRGPFLLHDEDAVILALFPVLSGFCSYVRSRNPVTFDFTCGFPDNQLSTLLRRCDTADFSCKENNDVPQIAMFFAIITSLYFHIFCLKQIYNYPRKFISPIVK